MIVTSLRTDTNANNKNSNNRKNGKIIRMKITAIIVILVTIVLIIRMLIILRTIIIIKQWHSLPGWQVEPGPSAEAVSSGLTATRAQNVVPDFYWGLVGGKGRYSIGII